MPKGNRKGSKFERDMCRRLSLWWTPADPTDDVFWRSSQSGGRATVRARKGKRTAGSYGDIVAMDLVGEPLLKVFTLELKRGRSHGEPGDLLDCNASPDCHKWIKTMEQARGSHEDAGSFSWLIISQRDFRRAAVFFPSSLLRPGQPLFAARKKLLRPPVFRYRIEQGDFMGMTLDKFLEAVHPSDLMAFVDNKKL